MTYSKEGAEFQKKKEKILSTHLVTRNIQSRIVFHDTGNTELDRKELDTSLK